MASVRLRIGEFGDPVKQVQKKLLEEGFAISPDEQKRKFFGPTTREAVGRFQAARGIERTCDVCGATAAQLALNAGPISPAGQMHKLEAIAAGTDRFVMTDNKLGALGRLPEIGVTERGD